MRGSSRGSDLRIFTSDLGSSAMDTPRLGWVHMWSSDNPPAFYGVVGVCVEKSEADGERMF